MSLSALAAGFVLGAIIAGAFVWISRNSALLRLSLENGRLKAAQDEAAKSYSLQIEQLTKIRKDIEDQFELLAARALKDNSDEFTNRANQKVSELVKPLGNVLEKYEAQLNEIEKARNVSYGSLDKAIGDIKAQYSQVGTLTSNLVNALKASPKTRGRWGEETLRRVMELSGMVEHCDFDTEKHFKGEDEALRPDVLIHVAGGRSIVVDAKAPTAAYLEAIEATSEEQRELLLKRHASQLRERLSNLSRKSYWECFDGSPDCVVMFVPGDNFVAAAFERDPSLFEDGVNARVLICTPTTFIALAKAISYGWRQEKLAANALEVARLGKELYARLRTLGNHIVQLGSHINSATKKYNDFVGSLESSVLPQARRFKELGIDGTSETIPELNSVETALRFPQTGRDLTVPQVPVERDVSNSDQV